MNRHLLDASRTLPTVVTSGVSDCHPMVVIGRDKERCTGYEAGPGRARQALVTVRLLSGHSANAPGRGDQAVRSQQARGPGRPSLGAFLGASAGRPAASDTLPWYQVSAGGATGA